MQIRLNESSVTVGTPVTGVVVPDTAVARGSVCFVRREAVDGRAVLAVKEVARLMAPAAARAVGAPVAFSAPTDEEPPTYRGRRLTIEHTLCVRAELLNGEVSELSEPVVLIAAPSSTAELTGAMPGRRLARGVGWILAAAALTLLIASRGALEASLAAGINLMIAARLLWPDLVGRRWDRLALRVQPLAVPMGESVTLTLEVRPRRDWNLRRGEAELLAEEVVVVPDADGHTTERETVCSVRAPLFDGPMTLTRSHSVTFTKSMDVPPDVAPSLRSASGRVEWQARIRLEGDTNVQPQTREFVVLPQQSRRSTTEASLIASRNEAQS